jgi:hypothetical protein
MALGVVAQCWHCWLSQLSFTLKQDSSFHQLISWNVFLQPFSFRGAFIETDATDDDSSLWLRRNIEMSITILIVLVSLTKPAISSYQYHAFLIPI